MKTVILCGGKGLRLLGQTEFIPKPLAEIGGMPILWHIMKIYSHFGHMDFILCLGYKGKMIKEYFLNFEYLCNNFTMNLENGKRRIEHLCKEKLENWNITFIDTGLDTNTGGRLKRIEKYIEGDNFFVTYGDGVASIDINKLLDFHTKKGRIATLTGIHPMSQFGVLEAENGMVKTFKEKPRLDGTINGGFFVFKREIFDYLSGDSAILEEEPLRQLTKKGQLAVYEHTDFWKSMETFKDVEFLNKIWNSGRVPWRLWK